MFADAERLDAELIGEHRLVDDVANDLRVRDEAAVRRGGDVAERIEPEFKRLRHGSCRSSGARRRRSPSWPGSAPKPDAKLLVFPIGEGMDEQMLGCERLAPVCSLFSVDGDDEAIALCTRLLGYEGGGHTAVVAHERPRARGPLRRRDPRHPRARQRGGDVLASAWGCDQPQPSG